MEEGERKEGRKKMRADKPLDFVNWPLDLSCLQEVCTLPFHVVIGCHKLTIEDFT